LNTQLDESKNSIKNYWDKEWLARTTGDQYKCNWQKFQTLVAYIHQFDKPEYKKLDIGCGVAPHAIALNWNTPNYTGIDLSDTGIESAKKKLPKANLISGNICELDLKDKYDIFLALDSLEHFPLADLKKLASKIRTWSKPSSIFIGNIPMYNADLQDDAVRAKVEFPMNYEILSSFLVRAGFPDITTRQYYTEGHIEGTSKSAWLPYMLFNAKR